MNEFALNRKQINKLIEIATKFPDVEWFTLTDDRSSGIGPTIKVKFNLFGDDDKDIDTIVDITDVSTW
jgi:hypothetical protein